ncbi:hypothetical protein N2152v2_002317 [Parachlorella kessleri]
MDLQRVEQRLEHALACEVLARHNVEGQLKELQRFVVDVSQLAPAEARAALASKADEIQKEWRAEKKGLKMLEELELQAAETWVEERGLGPSELEMLPSCEQRGDHLFVEPEVAVSPKRHGQTTGIKELIPGHA